MIYLDDNRIVTTQSVDEIIRNLTLFDDDLMSLVFDNNIEAANLLLRIILENEDIDVLDVTGQRELENPIVNGRNIKLDILARDGTGRMFDIEVQRDNGGAHIRRARFHSSMIDSRMLMEKQRFRELGDSYVIFITQTDYFRKKLPLYHITRAIEETSEKIKDGSHIIYVNGSYKGNDAIGRLIHDFSCNYTDDMYYDTLRKSVKHFKEGGEHNLMSKIVEDYANARAKEAAKEAAKKAAKETAKETALQTARRMLGLKKYEDEEIALVTDLKLEEVLKLKTQSA